jgi:hypothetical protein
MLTLPTGLPGLESRRGLQISLVVLIFHMAFNLLLFRREYRLRLKH